jgi:hypothetical protein
MPDVDGGKKVRYRLFWNWTGTRGIMTWRLNCPPTVTFAANMSTDCCCRVAFKCSDFCLKNELNSNFLEHFHNSMETRNSKLGKVNWIWMLKLARKMGKMNGMNPLLEVSKDHRSGPGYQCVGCWRSCCGRWGGAPPSECAAQCPTSSWSSGSLSGWVFCIFPPDPPPAGWVSSCELPIQPASGPRADTWFDFIESAEWEIRAKWEWNVIHSRNGSAFFRLRLLF